MSTKENNEVVVDSIDSEKDAKCEIKGTKRAAEVSTYFSIFENAAALDFFSLFRANAMAGKVCACLVVV